MGNLVSSCGSQIPNSSSPNVKSNIKINTATANTPKVNNIPKANAPKANNGPKANNIKKANYTMPLKNSKDGNTKINEPSPSSIKFTNKANVKEIPSRNKLPTNNSVPNNLQGKEFKSETSTPTKSAMKPNTRTNREKAAGINPNGSVLNTSINNALLKGAREGKVPNRKDINNLFLEENANGEKLLEEMTNPPPKPTFNMKPAPTGPSMVGGRRTKKHRKQRKH